MSQTLNLPADAEKSKHCRGQPEDQVWRPELHLHKLQKGFHQPFIFFSLIDPSLSHLLHLSATEHMAALHLGHQWKQISALKDDNKNIIRTSSAHMMTIIVFTL